VRAGFASALGLAQGQMLVGTALAVLRISVFGQQPKASLRNPGHRSTEDEHSQACENEHGQACKDEHGQACD
jgi:hypothetical protein